MVQVLEKHEISSRLRELGLDEPILREAVLAGELQRLSCTPFHPRSYTGFTAWGAAFARLAEDLHGRGWRKMEEHNLPIVVEPTRGIAVVVSSGNAFTGSRQWPPSTRYPKGPVFGVRVTGNQGVLFPEDVRFVPVPRREDLTTWLLLIHAEQLPKSHDIGSHVARCELSLPSAIDSEGWVTQWAERIVLEPITMDDVPLSSFALDWDGNEGPDVPVSRR